MLPEAFCNRMNKMLGAEYEDFAASFEREPYHALRVNVLKVGDMPCDTMELQFSLTPVPWAANGYYYAADTQPGKHPLHEAGAYYIQEPSAMAPVGLLEARPGERILDLCAAPGGKTTQIAAAMQGEGLLICNEIHPARAKILSENVERMGIRNACVLNETPAHLAEHFVEYFDRILVDAPCSGEGMFRKNEVAQAEWSEENVEACAARQDEILDNAAGMLRPGGRLVYSTCTFAPAENEGSINRFLHRHPEFQIVPIDKEARGFGSGADGHPEWTDRERDGENVEGLAGTLRLWPHKIAGEGHFAAVLTKKMAEEDIVPPHALGGLQTGIPAKNVKKDWADFLSFAEEEILLPGSDHRVEEHLLAFGENLYLMPEELPNLRGLKVLRPGLQLGTLKKNRFEPSHALALALSESEAKHVWTIPAEDALARAYLQGQTFPAEGEKGWYLICLQLDDVKVSLGWGKLAGGIMKNHYPKGLRKG